MTAMKTGGVPNPASSKAEVSSGPATPVLRALPHRDQTESSPPLWKANRARSDHTLFHKTSPLCTAPVPKRPQTPDSGPTNTKAQVKPPWWEAGLSRRGSVGALAGEPDRISTRVIHRSVHRSQQHCAQPRTTKKKVTVRS